MTIATLTVNPALDAGCRVDRVTPEHKLRCSEPELEPGGGGINVARAVQELGGQALALWTCGGPHGELLKNLLDEAGLPHRPIPVAGNTRQNLTVDETGGDQQYRFVFPGPQMTAADAGRCFDALESLDPAPEYLVFSGSLPPGLDEDFYAQAARRVTGRVIVDTSGRPLEEALEGGLYLIKPNIRELSRLAGREIEDDSAIISTARRLIDAGKVEVVVCSLGSGGAVLVTADETEHVRTPTVPIRSKVGAGDSMVAGIVLALARGKSVAESARFGVAAGAAAVMTPGTELCRRQDTERLYAQLSAADSK